MDLEYPKELHDKHNLYPLAPGHVQVTDDMLSPFQREHFPPIRSSVRKLVPNPDSKEKREEATVRGDAAAKDLFKLFNNATFWKDYGESLETA